MSYPDRPLPGPRPAAAMSARLSTFVLSLAALGVFTAGSPAADAPAETPPLPTLTLHDLLVRASGHLAAARRVELRLAEAQAQLDHLRTSRAFQVEVEGNYREENVDRVEVNGPRVKRGEQVDIRRQLTFSITRPLLGQSVEERLLAASQELRLIELRESAAIARREALLDLIGVYVDLAAEQRHRALRERAIQLCAEKARILTARHARGESLRRDVLAAEADLAARRAASAAGGRREAELRTDLASFLDGEAPPLFLAGELDWEAMRLTEPAPAAPPGPPLRAARTGPRSSIWYNLPEVDLRFFYTIASRDRTFADEVDDEEGHTPGVEVTLEFPLDLWRSGRSFARQVQARDERQRLALLAIERETAGRFLSVSLRHAEADARLEAAEAELALREEEKRVADLRAFEAGPGGGGEVALLDAELAVIDSRIALARARGDLARSYYERGMIAGADPIEMAAATSGPAFAERTPIPRPGVRP